MQSSSSAKAAKSSKSGAYSTVWHITLPPEDESTTTKTSTAAVMPTTTGTTDTAASTTPPSSKGSSNGNQPGNGTKIATQATSTKSTTTTTTTPTTTTTTTTTNAAANPTGAIVPANGSQKTADRSTKPIPPRPHPVKPSIADRIRVFGGLAPSESSNTSNSTTVKSHAADQINDGGDQDVMDVLRAPLHSPLQRSRSDESALGSEQSSALSSPELSNSVSKALYRPPAPLPAETVASPVANNINNHNHAFGPKAVSAAASYPMMRPVASFSPVDDTSSVAATAPTTPVARNSDPDALLGARPSARSGLKKSYSLMSKRSTRLYDSMRMRASRLPGIVFIDHDTLRSTYSYVSPSPSALQQLGQGINSREALRTSAYMYLASSPSLSRTTSISRQHATSEDATSLASGYAMLNGADDAGSARPMSMLSRRSIASGYAVLGTDTDSLSDGLPISECFYALPTSPQTRVPPCFLSGSLTSRDLITFSTTLGSGNFGVVMRGEIPASILTVAQRRRMSRSQSPAMQASPGSPGSPVSPNAPTGSAVAKRHPFLHEGLIELSIAEALKDDDDEEDKEDDNDPSDPDDPMDTLRSSASSIPRGSFSSVQHADDTLSLELKATTVQVAVKILKEGADDKSKDDFAEEAAAMAKFGHPNIVRVLAYFAECEPYLLVLEFLEYGDVRDLMQQCWGDEANTSALLPVRDAEFVHILSQIASAMAYLASLRFVHRDLAARNCLVGGGLTVKISDFGLSRALDEDSDYYLVKTRGALPVKWMAPESLKLKRFSTATDVYGMGVTMWEIYSYGAAPFKDIPPFEVIDLVDKGKRLDQPAACSLQIYSLMLKCWEADPTLRPSFDDIGLFLRGTQTAGAASEIRDLGKLLADIKAQYQLESGGTQ
ncbi:protein tyrosine kinase [Capsaspora owczarzaki ATCC 30864]|nr:protein tyrosine kinase [Capsaspora owczarzaki ATCC 30864]|eukprot:XP_004347041.2 protein tyrosine kinase [Capsaspora owczarzaki ATCC 30864]